MLCRAVLLCAVLRGAGLKHALLSIVQAESWLLCSHRLCDLVDL